MAKPKVSIIVLTFNGLNLTKEELIDISKLETKGLDAETIVVDNGSKDGTEEALSNYKLPNMGYKFIETGANLGFAGGNNVGIKDALDRGADYVMVLNNDTILDRNVLVCLTGVLEQDQSVGAVSPKIYFAPGFEFHKERYDKIDIGKVIWYAGGKIDWKNVYGSTRGVDEVDAGKYDTAQETDFATGTCLILRVKALEEVGLFDEKFFMYYEDTDLSQRMKKAGWKVLYYPGALIWHKVAQSSGIGSELNDYFLTRNRMIFGMKYASLRTKFALFRESIKLLLKGRKWQKIGTRDFYLGRWGKGSWGLQPKGKK